MKVQIMRNDIGIKIWHFSIKNREPHKIGRNIKDTKIDYHIDFLIYSNKNQRNTKQLNKTTIRGWFLWRKI